MSLPRRPLSHCFSYSAAPNGVGRDARCPSRAGDIWTAATELHLLCLGSTDCFNGPPPARSMEHLENSKPFEEQPILLQLFSLLLPLLTFSRRPIRIVHDDGFSFKYGHAWGVVYACLATHMNIPDAPEGPWLAPYPRRSLDPLIKVYLETCVSFTLWWYFARLLDVWTVSTAEA
jgi:hypothetical protein